MSGPLPRVPCPNCHREADDATCVREPAKRPQAGDFTVCIYCGVLMAYDAEMRPGALNDEQVTELLENPARLEEIRRIQGMIHYMRHSKG